MFDYFRIEPCWPGRKNIQSSDTALQKAKELEQEILLSISSKLVITKEINRGIFIKKKFVDH